VLMVLYLVITWCGTFPVSPHSWAGDIPSRDNLAMHI